MLRNTREGMSIPGNVFDREHAQRDSDELNNCSRNLAMSLAIPRTEGIDNSGSKSKEKKSRRQMSLMSMTNHAVGIETCTQSMTIPSYLPSGMHLQKFTDQTEFQSGIVNFQAGVCAEAKNLALVLQWIKRSKQPAR